MINQENLIKMYESILKQEELTTLELKEIGFTNTDLTNLVSKGELERTRRGYYKVIPTINLYNYGKKLIASNDYSNSKTVFKYIYSLNQLHYDTCYQLLFNSLKENNYKEALNYLKSIYNIDKYYNSFAHSNLILYLLSMDIDLPDKYKEYLESLKYEDYKITDCDDIKTTNIENKIVSLALNQKFSLARKETEKLMKQDSFNIRNTIIRELLIRACITQDKEKKHLISLINNKNYCEVIEYLENTAKKHRLSRYNKYINILAKDYIEIKKTSIIPEIQEHDNSFYGMLKAKDYIEALKLYDYNPWNNQMYNLLIDINELINNIKSRKLSPEEAKTNDIDSIINSLIKNDIDTLSLKLRSYLSSIGKLKYESLIMELIKISILENDKTFTKPISFIAELSKPSSKFNVTNYMESYYDCILKNKYELAKSYLSILSKAYELGLHTVKTSKLKKLLPRSNKSEEEKFIEEKHKLLLEKHGIILLKPMIPERIEKILEIVNRYPDISAFSIGEENKKQIVLRYKANESEYQDIKNIFDKANQNYRDKRYNACIKDYLKLLAYFNDPEPYIYLNLGVYYLKIKKKSIAIDYLTVASELKKKQNSNFNLDTDELLFRLKNSYDDKITVKMEESEFKNDLNNYYGVEEVDKVRKLLSAGMKLEKIYTLLKLDSEKQSIILLILARDYYARENYTLGDKYLKKVERTKNKSKFVKDLFDEVRKNKKFYKNRVNNEAKQLVLKPTM